MNNIKYALQPVYQKLKEEKVKLLYGYIVSKCYVLEEDLVFFPYYFSNYDLTDIIKRNIEDVIVGFNTNNVNTTYDDYDSAKNDCIILNNAIYEKTPRNIKAERISQLNLLERKVNLLTKNMDDKKVSINSKNMVR